MQSVAVPPRSLLVFSGEAYEDCLHGIDEVENPSQQHVAQCWHGMQRRTSRCPHCLMINIHSCGQVEEEQLDDSIANLHMLPPSSEHSLPRQGQRVSLTVRRVLRVRKSLLRL